MSTLGLSTMAGTFSGLADQFGLAAEVGIGNAGDVLAHARNVAARTSRSARDHARRVGEMGFVPSPANDAVRVDIHGYSGVTRQRVPVIVWLASEPTDPADPGKTDPGIIAPVLGDSLTNEIPDDWDGTTGMNAGQFKTELNAISRRETSWRNKIELQGRRLEGLQNADIVTNLATYIELANQLISLEGEYIVTNNVMRASLHADLSEVARRVHLNLEWALGYFDGYDYDISEVSFRPLLEKVAVIARGLHDIAFPERDALSDKASLLIEEVTLRSQLSTEDGRAYDIFKARLRRLQSVHIVNEATTVEAGQQIQKLFAQFLDLIATHPNLRGILGGLLEGTIPCTERWFVFIEAFIYDYQTSTNSRTFLVFCDQITSLAGLVARFWSFAKKSPIHETSIYHWVRYVENRMGSYWDSLKFLREQRDAPSILQRRITVWVQDLWKWITQS